MCVCVWRGGYVFGGGGGWSVCLLGDEVECVCWGGGRWSVFGGGGVEVECLLGGGVGGRGRVR